jgi:RNA polymerase sigma factor (sigma-70 family)
LSTTTPSLGDSGLTRRAADGSSRAFEAIFERYHQELYRYCAAIVGNAADAQDAVQSTMVKVLQALPGEERRIELKPWLYRIAHNEAIEIVRRRLPAEGVDADGLLGAASTADEVLARDRLRRLVADVAELPERQRGALVMRELGGLGFEEIGAALGTSAAGARQTLYEARLGLRQMSEGREMECAEAMRTISDGDRRLLRGRKLRAHLRACDGCRAFRAEIDGRRGELGMIAPLPAAAVLGLLSGVLGGGGAGAAAAGGGAGAAAGGGASVAGTAGAAAGKTMLGATALKAAAAVGVVVAIGATAADQRGLIHLGSGHSEGSPPARSSSPPTGAAGTGAAPSSPADGTGRARSAAAGTESGHPSQRDLATSHPIEGQAAAGAPAGAPGPHPAAGTPATSGAPDHGDNGRHLGQLEHPEHGHDAGAKTGSHGRSASAPGHMHPQPAKHGSAPAKQGTVPTKVPPGQAKKAPPAEEAAAAPAGQPANPAPQGKPEKPARAAAPPVEAHGKADAESPSSE